MPIVDSSNKASLIIDPAMTFQNHIKKHIYLDPNLYTYLKTDFFSWHIKISACIICCYNCDNSLSDWKIRYHPNLATLQVFHATFIEIKGHFAFDFKTAVIL